MTHPDDVSKEFLFEIIEDAGKTGITSGEIKDQFPAYAELGRTFGGMLSGLLRQKRICQVDDFWYTIANAPQTTVTINTEDEGDTSIHRSSKQQERPFQKGWSGATIAIHRDPERFGKVIRIQLCERRTGVFFDIPVMSSLRILITTREMEEMEIPPYAVPYFGVSEIRIDRRQNNEVVTTEVVIQPRETVIWLPQE